MNEKIKELANKAGCDYLYDYSSDGHAMVCNVSDIEKFAELIVKECAYLVNDQQRTTGYTTHAQMLCREFGIDYRDEDYYGRA